MEQRLFLSPPSSPSPSPSHANSLEAERKEVRAREDSASCTYATEAAKQSVFIKVLRAWDLVETLGGCRPYVDLDWGALGTARTEACPESCNPEFSGIASSCLQFRSPAISNGPSAELLAALGEDILVAWADGKTLLPVFLPPLNVSVYSANNSVSDEFVGDGQADALLLLEQPGSHTVQLFDGMRRPAGVVELQFSFSADE